MAYCNSPGVHLAPAAASSTYMMLPPYRVASVPLVRVSHFQASATACPVSQALYRRYTLRGGACATARKQPRSDAEAIVCVPPGTSIFTTGRVRGAFVEVHNVHLQCGWLPLASLEPCGSGGRHGDHLEAAGGTGTLLRDHNDMVLRIDLVPELGHLHTVRRRDGFLILKKPGHGYLQGDSPSHQAHVYTSRAGSAGLGPLPLLIMLHGSRPLTWNFEEATEMFQEIADAYDIVVLCPESHGPTWDYLLTAMRDDVDFIQNCVNRLCAQFAIDQRRIALMGHSDGGSLGLSLALRNPSVFDAALVYATGFFVEPSGAQMQVGRPRIWLDYGKLDRMFGFEAIAVPNKCKLERLGYKVEFRGVDGAGHQPPPEFFSDSIAFWLGIQPSAATLHRKYVLRGHRYVPVCKQPSVDAEVICYQKPGALIFTTGQLHDGFVEVHNAHLGCGWMPLVPLEPSGSGGQHGDALESTANVDSLLRAYKNDMLKVELATPVHLQVMQGHGGSLVLQKPGNPWLQGEPAGHRAHVLVPMGLQNKRTHLPLLVFLHGSRPLEWDFESYVEAFQEYADAYGLIILVPESHGPTWDFMLTGAREDMDFIQGCIHNIRARFAIDDRRIAIMGHSDGASVGLSMALRNPDIFSAALLYAMGFFVEARARAPTPCIWLEYGMRDRLFGPESVAKPNKQRLGILGYQVQFRIKDEFGHMTHPAFFHDSIHFWLRGGR